MADPAKQICDELGVSREEALFYLEGFRWDLNVAMEACRDKKLPSPSLTVESSPENEKYESEASSSLKLMEDSRPSSNPSEEQSRNQQIEAFCTVVLGATVDDADHYLRHTNWNLNLAVDSFMSDRRPTLSERKSNSQPLSNDGRTTISKSSLQGISGNKTSDMRQDVMNGVPQFRINLKGLRISSSSPHSSKEFDPRETLNEAEAPLSQLKKESIRTFCEVVGQSPQVALDCLNKCKWKVEDAVNYFFNGYTEAIPGLETAEVDESGNPWPPMHVWVDQICHAAGVCREEALFYLEGFKWKFDTAMEACRSKTLPPMEETSSSVCEESAEAPPIEQLISSFQETAVGVTKEVAIDYLTACNWNVDQAVGFFIDGHSVEQVSAALVMSLMENRDTPLPPMELPSQSQFEASYRSQNQGYLKEGRTGSSSSSTIIGPTETQRSLEEAGEGTVTVPIHGMASSQVDYGKAVEEYSSTETCPDPFANQDRTTVGTQTAPATITVTIVLADDGSGKSLDLPLRSDQTVRDIRNAIDERTPDNNRDYCLLSTTGVEYTDLNITVYRISTGGSTTLIQTFTDP